jgi:hypothetical protein
MAKKETTPKPRAEKYDPKVKFEGSLEDMIKISVKPIHGKKTEQSKENGGISSGG